MKPSSSWNQNQTDTNKERKLLQANIFGEDMGKNFQAEEITEEKLWRLHHLNEEEKFLFLKTQDLSVPVVLIIFWCSVYIHINDWLFHAK